MEPIELKYKAGPFGDETSLYDVIFFKKDMTVQELIDYVLNRNSCDWGYVSIMGTSGWLDHKYRLEYRYGLVVTDNIPTEIKSKVIFKCIASGGWSRMDYDIYGV